MIPSYEKINNEVRPCADIYVYYNNKLVNVNYTTYQLYFDDVRVVRFNDVVNLTPGEHNFKCVVLYKGLTAIREANLVYGN